MRSFLFLWLATSAFGQVLSNASLSGAYNFRHLLMVSDGGTGLADIRTTSGTLTFDGRGGFTLTSQQLVKTAAPVALNGAGTYSVKPSGVTTITSPQFGAFSINARLGTTALVGSATEAGPGIFDLLIAIPAASTALTNAALTGPYHVSSLELPAGNINNIRNTSFKITANGAGSVTENSVSGQARNLGNRFQTQTIAPITYLVSPDATGILNFPTIAGLNETSQLILGAKNLFVSADGSVFIGGALTAGAHGILVGVKAFAGGASNTNFSGFFYNAGLRFDADRPRLSSYAAAVNATTLGAVFGRRTRQTDGLFDASTVATYALSADGSGAFTSTSGRVNLASSGAQFTTSGAGFADSPSYELSFGVRMPPQSGTGVFIDPQRVLNGANFALGYPVTPGGYVTLFGTGLAASAVKASSLPYPATLGGVSATVNGKAAPISFVAPDQINLIVPYSTTGTTATFVVTNGTASNAVEVPLVAAAPGVFSPAFGLGEGAVTHANGSLVTASSPALPSEVVVVYLSGMGAVSPTVIEGAAVTGLLRATALTAVTIGGINADILFNGLTPGLASLYQLNVRVPATLGPGAHSLAVQTLDGFTDMVTLRVGRL